MVLDAGENIAVALRGATDGNLADLHDRLADIVRGAITDGVDRARIDRIESACRESRRVTMRFLLAEYA